MLRCVRKEGAGGKCSAENAVCVTGSHWSFVDYHVHVDTKKFLCNLPIEIKHLYQPVEKLYVYCLMNFLHSEHV